MARDRRRPRISKRATKALAWVLHEAIEIHNGRDLMPADKLNEWRDLNSLVRLLEEAGDKHAPALRTMICEIRPPEPA